MKAVSKITKKEINKVKGVLFDLDDTFTVHGKIIPEAFSALWNLHEMGLVLVPITGRPAGWCDHIARMWPVDGVVGENGALCYYYCNRRGRLMRHYAFEPETAKEKRALLETIKREVLKRVPRAKIAADQHFRLFDLAIDFAEDVPALTHEEVQQICSVFHKHLANYKVSSIHVNGWFGDYNKLSMTRYFLKAIIGLEWKEVQNAFIFIGDSPNDEPMFEAFPISVGVANIKRFLPMMKTHPAYITKAEGGLGFAEMAHMILH
jgi:hypothetical protein